MNHVIALIAIVSAAWLSSAGAFGADALKVAIGQREIWHGSPASLGARRPFPEAWAGARDSVHRGRRADDAARDLRQHRCRRGGRHVGRVRRLCERRADPHHRRRVDRRGRLLVRARGFAGQVDGRHGRPHDFVFHDRRIHAFARAGLPGKIQGRCQASRHRRLSRHVHASDVRADRRRLVGAALCHGAAAQRSDPHHRARPSCRW